MLRFTLVICILPILAVTSCSLVFSDSGKEADAGIDTADAAVDVTAGCEPWERSFAGLGAGSDSIVDVAVDGACGTVLCGTINGTYNPVDASPIAGDDGQAFVARVDAKGMLVWAKLFGGEFNTDRCKAVALGPGGAGQEDVFVLADVRAPGSVDDQSFVDAPDNLDTDMLIARLAGDSGKAQWVRGVGSSGADVAHAIAVSNDRVYFSGFGKEILYFQGDASISSGPAQTIVIALDHEGENRQSRVISNDFIMDAGSTLNVLESGELLMTLTKDQSYQLDDCAITRQGKHFTTILRLDTDLNCLWSNIISAGEGESREVTAAGLVIAGEVATIVGTGDAVNYSFTGADIKDLSPIGTSGTNVWIARLHLAEGIALSLDVLGGPQEETARGVVLDSEGRAHMLGNFRIEAELADIAIMGNGTMSSFVAVFHDDNTLLRGYLLGEPEDVRTSKFIEIIDGWTWFAGRVVGDEGNDDGFLTVQELR